ncbi:MAG TPA: hypothetical protein VIQ30_25895 [Pseudonocardia sp.]
MTRTTLAALAVAGALVGGLAAPANAAVGRPVLTNSQLVKVHDCRPISTTPDPTRLVRGWLRDNLATPQRDLVYVSSHGTARFGHYRTTHYCYR